MTRIALSLVAAAAALCWQVPSSQAAIYGDAPWCAVMNVGAGFFEWDCEFRSVEECTPNIVAGNRGFCNLNPYWTPPAAPDRGAPRHRKHHVRQD